MAIETLCGVWKFFVVVGFRFPRTRADHDPVDGNHPVGLWDGGDVILDVQQRRIPTRSIQNQARKQ